MALLPKIAGDYLDATQGVQNVGKQIITNVSQGQRNFKSGKAGYNASINPFKGTGKAFTSAFKKGKKYSRVTHKPM